MIRNDGYYLSEPQTWVRNEGGRREEEEYFYLYQFFADGSWICKTAPSSGFDFQSFLEGLDMESLRNDPLPDEPQLPNGELVYQTGTFNIESPWLLVEWKNTKVQKDPLRWMFRILDEENLETVGGEWQLRFVAY